VFFMLRTAASRAVRFSRLSVAASVLAVVLPFAGAADARGLLSWGSSGSDESTIAVADLPAQGQLTMKLILQGGPFPYEKDGSVFGNRERLLPRERRGYYREYTVETPRSRDRGARRIICGGRQLTAPEACWYTNDHYSSFRKIVP